MGLLPLDYAIAHPPAGLAPTFGDWVLPFFPPDAGISPQPSREQTLSTLLARLLAQNHGSLALCFSSSADTPRFLPSLHRADSALANSLSLFVASANFATSSSLSSATTSSPRRPLNAVRPPHSGEPNAISLSLGFAAVESGPCQELSSSSSPLSTRSPCLVASVSSPLFSRVRSSWFPLSAFSSSVSPFSLLHPHPLFSLSFSDSLSVFLRFFNLCSLFPISLPSLLTSFFFFSLCLFCSFSSSFFSFLYFFPILVRFPNFTHVYAQRSYDYRRSARWVINNITLFSPLILRWFFSTLRVPLRVRCQVLRFHVSVWNTRTCVGVPTYPVMVWGATFSFFAKIESRDEWLRYGKGRVTREWWMIGARFSEKEHWVFFPVQRFPEFSFVLSALKPHSECLEMCNFFDAGSSERLLSVSRFLWFQVKFLKDFSQILIVF